MVKPIYDCVWYWSCVRSSCSTKISSPKPQETNSAQSVSRLFFSCSTQISSLRRQCGHEMYHVFFPIAAPRSQIQSLKTQAGGPKIQNDHKNQSRIPNPKPWASSPKSKTEPLNSGRMLHNLLNVLVWHQRRHRAQDYWSNLRLFWLTNSQMTGQTVD